VNQSDRPEVWDRVIGAGADWLQTDLPEEVIAREFHKRPKRPPVKIACHRGANRYAPENALPAFEKAIRLGADFVEFDVRTTSDGQFYLLHDGNLDRTTSGKGPIREAPAATVAGLDAGAWFGQPFAGLHPPSLEEFLTATEGKIDLYFDAKDIAPEALAKALAQHGMTGRTVVYQGKEYLQRLAAIDPRIRALPPLRRLEDLDTLATDLHPYAVDASWELLSREMIARCHALGIKVFSDALGNHETIENYRQAIGWGIDLIQTDHPLRVMRALELGPKGSSERLSEK
jgi:glycerophosphoryl diester phosphodiesterase